MLNYDVGAKRYWHQYDCNPYSEDGKLTSSNKYTIREWSHDRFHSELVHNNPILDPHGDEILGPSESLYDHFLAWSLRVCSSGNMTSIFKIFML